jgi:hypothetical protein
MLRLPGEYHLRLDFMGHARHTIQHVPLRLSRYTQQYERSKVAIVTWRLLPG